MLKHLQCIRNIHFVVQQSSSPELVLPPGYDKMFTPYSEMNVCILTFQPLLSGEQMSVWGEEYLVLLIQIYRYVPNHRTEIPIFLTVCFIILST